MGKRSEGSLHGNFFVWRVFQAKRADPLITASLFCSLALSHSLSLSLSRPPSLPLSINVIAQQAGVKLHPGYFSRRKRRTRKKKKANQTLMCHVIALAFSYFGRVGLLPPPRSASLGRRRDDDGCLVYVCVNQYPATRLQALKTRSGINR